MSAATDVRALLGYAWVQAGRGAASLAERARIARPRLLGPAIRGPLVQLYRSDEAFATEVNLVNYLSFYLPGEDLAIDFTVTAYDRDGRRLGSGRRRVGRHQAAQQGLGALVGAPLDAHGLFTVEADYDPDMVERIAFLGETAPQFMTLFVPAADAAPAPQILHSHKLFWKSRIPYSPCKWVSPSIERPAAVEEYSLFVLNACGSALAGEIEFRGVENPDAVWRRGYRVPGRGVGRLDVRPAEWGLPLDQPFRFTCRFDRRTPHRKPILFRRFADGSLSGNHS
jgi:hypothetical protein